MAMGQAVVFNSYCNKIYVVWAMYTMYTMYVLLEIVGKQISSTTQSSVLCQNVKQVPQVAIKIVIIVIWDDH